METTNVSMTELPRIDIMKFHSNIKKAEALLNAAISLDTAIGSLKYSSYDEETKKYELEIYTEMSKLLARKIEF